MYTNVQHLKMLQVNFGKDEHGEHDINHKQNCNAVLNIIS